MCFLHSGERSIPKRILTPVFLVAGLWITSPMNAAIHPIRGVRQLNQRSDRRAISRAVFPRNTTSREGCIME
ncbi:hypothetical protein BJ322DRAFT_1091106 [Thelephora terrestris]|uniref:Uncharacterized protein n=1 Tax=Thelephora terrestris TaxID=56493 RepID=A0A9P6L1F2_9AGAM|nr:hypothetical protein BJ322DRAFT_1091106 [Thelephora terrestris]